MTASQIHPIIRRYLILFLSGPPNFFYLLRNRLKILQISKFRMYVLWNILAHCSRNWNKCSGRKESGIYINSSDLPKKKSNIFVHFEVCKRTGTKTLKITKLKLVSFFSKPCDLAYLYDFITLLPTNRSFWNPKPPKLSKNRGRNPKLQSYWWPPAPWPSGWMAQNGTQGACD